jgi:3-methyladenine DNA glycosylase/8-oxoguanine DNA glycosylase
MATRLTIAVPADYVLARDYCSYGYFLLAPHHWLPDAGAFTTTLALAEGPAAIAVGQEGTGSLANRPLPRGYATIRRARGHPLIVKADRGLTRAERDQLRRLLTRMLRLDETDEVIGAFHTVDPRFKPAGRGRLMRSPTFFEDVIKTVTSCNVTWPSTVMMNRRLCQVLGKAASFPTPQKIARTRLATLRARCRVGYRDARIVELADLFASREIDPEWFEDPATPDDAIHDRLLELPGIGPYAAANIMQLLGRYHRLPLDTESVRHGKTVLRLRGSSKQIMKRLHRHYAPFGDHAFRSYWFELWQFYESKQGPSWTWSRDTTGTTFTASMLNKP